MDKYIGRLLDNRYEILEVIGTGGMAVVYKARCHRLNRLVAIKILNDDFLEDAEFRERFHSESQAVAMLGHPNIVSVYDVSSSDEADYIVMELIDGITLKQYMEKKGVLNWKETLHFAIQIAKALEHAHSRGIVHRDIKPHNVMVLKNGSVKVTDFGIARMMSKGNTLTKEALGSVHYISPEQAKGGRVDNRSDIYSLGVVLYEMMSGRPPYDGESPVAVAIQHINGGAAMPSTLNPNIPGGLEQIIMKAMGHEPAQRYATASMMLADLDEFRKNPGVLFEYNTPPLDAVTTLPKPPIPIEVPPTTAERVERRNNGGDVMDRKAAAQRQAQRRRKQQEQARKRSNVAMIAVISCTVTIIVAVAVLCAMFFLGSNGSNEPEPVYAPNLLGMVYEELPDYEDFVVKFIDKVYSEEYPAGQVMEQVPKAGDPIGDDGTIYVTVSRGKAPVIVEMPDVKTYKLEEAERVLNNLNLNLQLDVKEEYSDTVTAGNVIRTEPASGTELENGQEITLFVSKGPQIITASMPDVIGETIDEAKRILDSQKLGLSYKIEEQFDFLIPMGEVISTDPEPYEKVQTGQTVLIIVSKGPEVAVMKKLVGLTAATAIEVLKNNNFTNWEIEMVESTQPKDTVVEQSVAEGEEVATNTKIIMKVSSGQVTKTVTIQVPTAEALGEQGIPENAYTAEDGTVNLTIQIKQGTTVFHTQKDLNFQSGSFTVSLTGSGVQTFEIWVNGNVFSEIEVDFTK